MNEFKCFVEDEKAKLAECLRGSGRLDEDSPDIPAISGADSLKEQYYWFMLGINSPPHQDDIDWQALEKQLKVFADKVAIEWHKQKKAQDKRAAVVIVRE
jgi:hypothetical protein